MLSSLYRYLRVHGVRQTASAAWQALRRHAYIEERLIVIVKDLDSIVEPGRPTELRLEDLAAEHLSELSELNRRRGRPDIDRRFARYVEQGFHGFVAYRGEELVGYYWWVDRDVPTLFPDLRRLGLGIELGEGDVYGSDLFLLEEHRGGGAAADLLFQVESSLRDRGCKRIWGYVVSNNRPARWIYSLRGYAPMWIVNRRKVLIRQRTSRETS
ncbi:MAG: N-acetyltransferase family protein [Solirubrobacteraceae bacterium]